MKIAFFNPIGEIGGAERVLLLLLTELGKSDRSSQFTLILGDDGPLRTAAERIGVPTHVLRLPKSLAAFGDSDISTGRGGFIRLIRKSLLAAVAIPATLGYLLRLRSTIGRLKPDILHANGIKAQLLAALVRPRGVKLVWHLHDFIGDRALVSRLMRRLSHRATIAVANSESVRNDAASLLAPLEVRTIYNGIDVDRFTPGASDVATIDRPAGFGSLRPDAIRVGLVATYARWKGQETFLEAAAEILRRCSESPLYFYIVGGPIYRTHGSQYSLDELRGVAE